MDLKDELLAIERGFWLDGEDFFLDHLDDRCMLVFAEMKGVYSRAEVAASARNPDRWRDLRIADTMAVQPSENVAVISYEARVMRGTGGPYRALIGSTYVRKNGAWKLVCHQHSALAPDRA